MTESIDRYKMKFDEIFPKLKSGAEIQCKGSFLIKGSEKKRCAICNQATQWIDGNFEAYLCSEACEDKMWEELSEAIEKAGPITLYEFENK
jgi:hypothetical protein